MSAVYLKKLSTNFSDFSGCATAETRKKRIKAAFCSDPDHNPYLEYKLILISVSALP